MVAGSEPIFVIRELRKRRAEAGSAFELRVPELVVRPGQVVVLRGISGSGKSTLLDVLAMALRPDRAECFTFAPDPDIQSDILGLWRNGNIDELGRLRGRHIGYVLQTGGLLPFLTVGENIALPRRLLGQRSRDGIDELTRRLGIAGQLNKRPAQLSVGERQRVAIARALVHRPRVVLADEPTASVDPLNAEAILALFLELVQQLGVTAIIASHDWERIAAAGFLVLDHRIERRGQTTRASFWS
jgi:putative ABC transport system ATP-binding protein